MKTGSILTVLLLSAQVALGLGIAPVGSEYRDYEILVKFRAGVTEEEVVALEQDFALSRINRFDSVGVYHYWLPVELTVPAAVDLLSQHDWVDVAEPNFFRALSSYDSPHTNQWYLKNTGQNANGITGPPGNDINWTAAISKFTTTNSVIVAVVDTGIALNHEDLLANIWTNSSETLNGRDDDGNGLVDDLFGYDFVNDDPLPYDEFESGHGSLVAGIIGGVADNGRGIVGICPRAKIMSLRIFGQFRGQGGTVAEIIAALEYARLKGAKIINCSFGGEGSSSSERAAFAAVRDAGILVVCAAGNDENNNDQAPFYPAAYNFSNMVNVAAVDRTLGLASFSNYGSNSVQVGAPGTDMYSTAITRIDVFQDDFQTGVSNWISGGVGGGYRWKFLTTNFNTYLSDGSWSSLNRDAEPYKPGTDTWMQSPRISLTRSIGSQLSFSADYDLADDMVWIETSNDSVNWSLIGYIYGSSSWGPISSDFSSADGQDVYFRFHLISNESLQGRGISIDDIKITRVSDFSDGKSVNYAFNDGTSFAAPVVSGVAALALAQRPDLTYTQVKSLILSNTRPVAALAGKVGTGGIVNADKVMTALRSVPVGSLAPVITANPKSQMVTAGATASFSVTAKGPAPLSYQWLFNGRAISGATGASYTIAKVQFGQAGNYAAVVSNSFSSVTSATAALIVDGSSAFGIIGAPFSYQITADNNPTGYSASGLPPGLSCDVVSGLISGTPTQTGTFRVLVEAKSIFSSASATVVIKIINGSITSETSADGIVGVPFSYQIAADNNPSGYSASGLPPGFRCDSSSGVISGTPTGTGTFSVRVEAKSIFSSASATVLISIGEGSITSATDADGVVGVPFTYQITADNEPSGYSASGLPPGFRCDPSGLILGIPTGAGVYQVRVEAKSIFSAVSDTVIIAIVDGSITSATSAEGIVGVPFTYQISADNEPSGYSASGLPPGFRCDPSGLILGIPAGAGTFPVRVEAKNIFGSASATVVITISEGSIIGGTAPPALTISRNGDKVLLAWPVTSDGFILEEIQLPQNTWTNSSATVVTQGNQSVAVIPVQSTAKFYRLRK